MKKSESLCLSCMHYDPADDVIVKTQFQDDFNLAPTGGLCMYRNIPRPLPVAQIRSNMRDGEFVPEVLECNKYKELIPVHSITEIMKSKDDLFRQSSESESKE